MYRSAGGILLKHKNARSFPELGVVLHQDRRLDTVKHVNNQNIIIYEFIIAVIRNANFALRHKRPYSGQGCCSPFVAPLTPEHRPQPVNDELHGERRQQHALKP